MSLEHILTSARDSTTTLKFDGRLEPIVGSSTEIGKEDFVDLLKEKVREFGQETFYYVKDTSNLTFELFENAHYFRLETLMNEFFNHYDKYKDVISEIKTEHVVNLCKSDLKSLIQQINERNSYINEVNTNYINPNEIEKFIFLKNRLGYENMSDAYSVIAGNDSFVLNDIKSQIINFRNGTLNFDVENIQTLIDSFGKCIQYLSVNDLEFLSKMVENNELFSLLTLEPILITKIGVTIILRN